MQPSARTQPMPSLRLLLVAFALMVSLLSVGVVQASDAPHWVGALTVLDCTSSCHALHAAPGGQLTSNESNVQLCHNCHADVVGRDLPADADKADPVFGSGTSHAWDVAAINATYGTVVPSHQEMSLRVMEDNIVCSTCHNQHSADGTLGGTSRISPPGDTITSEGSTGTLATSGIFTGPTGVWYLIEITETGSATSARYRYSKDNGGTWFPSGCSSADTTTCLTATDTPSELPDLVGVELTFTGGSNTIRVNERWEFFATWPFLRAKLDQGSNATADKFCRDCHAAWVMEHGTDVTTWNGGSVKSHPVGVGLGVNGGGYDRSAPADGNGLPQASHTGLQDVDGNPTNDLALDGSGNVQCLSCHGVHYADSNTLSVDSP